MVGASCINVGKEIGNFHDILVMLPCIVSSTVLSIRERRTGYIHYSKPQPQKKEKCSFIYITYILCCLLLPREVTEHLDKISILALVQLAGEYATQMFFPPAQMASCSLLWKDSPKILNKFNSPTK